MERNIKKLRATCALAMLLLLAALAWGCNNKSADADNQTAEPDKKATTQTAESKQPAKDKAYLTPPSLRSSEPTKESSPEPPKEPKAHKPQPVYMGVWGSVGGTGFLFDMNGLTGSYRPYDIADAREYGQRRQLKLEDYDPKSGRCIINAYLKGEYIGQFDGICEEMEVEKDDGMSYGYQAYNGIFTSNKGARLEFHFHFD